MLVLVLVLVSPINESNAASTKVTVKTKVLTYKGQNYIQANGGNKAATDNINKILKQHAVQTDTWSEENKKQNNGFNSTTPSVKYNNNEILSVVYTDIVNVGGLTNVTGFTAYNFNIKTGKIINLKEIISTKNQSKNLIDALTTALEEKSRKGVSIEKESINNVPLEKSIFYYYDTGIVIHFDRYVVSMTDAVDIKVPFAVINKTALNGVVINKPLIFNLNKDTKTNLENGKIPGFSGISFGMSKKQVSDIFGKKPLDSYFYYGGEFWRYEIMPRAGFNFDNNDNTDSLRYVLIGKEYFTFKTFADVKKVLGDAKETYDEYEEEYILRYKFGKTTVDFTSVTSEGIVLSITLYQK
jgi:hypothetical protein